MVSLATSLNGIIKFILPSAPAIGTMIIYAAFFFFLAATLVVNKFKFKNVVIGFVLFFVSVTALSMWGDSRISYFVYRTGNTILENAIFVFFVLTFSGLVITTYLKDYSVLYKYMERFSYAVIFLAFVSYFFFTDEKTNETYMSFSYSILLQTVFITLLSIKEFRMRRLIFSVMGFILLLIAGSRGALVSGLLCLVFYILIFSFKSPLRKITVIFLLLLLTFLVYNNFEVIIDFIDKVLTDMNIDSRNILLITRGKFTDDSGRSIIQETILENLNLFGYGFFADRLIANGSYSHNLFIEFLYTFGILGGSLLSAILVFVIIRSILKASDTEQIILITFLSTGFMKLMFSGSFLNQEPGFYVLLGMCICLLKRSKKISGNIKEKEK